MNEHLLLAKVQKKSQEALFEVKSRNWTQQQHLQWCEMKLIPNFATLGAYQVLYFAWFNIMLV